MTFISVYFLAFFVVVMLGLRLVPSRTPRQWILLLASVYFYASWKPLYLLVLATALMINYFGAIRIERSCNGMMRKVWLAAAVSSNLGLLAYFKYANFFLSNVAAVSGSPPKHINIVLPLGISFFTFKSLGYTIDVYRCELIACRSLWKYALFMCYFPDLIAGPIVRASVFLPQLERSLVPSLRRTIVGCHIILLGITKKLLIADQMAIFVDPVFSIPRMYSPLTVWSAVIAYSLQIYCDFSGYSDIAIGLSAIIGIDLPVNFNMPYLATSPVDFWRRWHISLSTWFRDYLFSALPADRAKPWHQYRNAAVTFLLSGLWHGPSWTFVGWGAIHGLAYAASNSRSARRRHVRHQSLSTRFFCWLATYMFICITWVVFRAQSFSAAFVIFRKMGGFAPGGVVWLYSPFLLVLPIVIGAHVIGVKAARGYLLIPWRITVLQPVWLASFLKNIRAFAVVRCSKQSGVYVLTRPTVLGAFALTSWILALVLFGAVGISPFIYFQF